MESYENLTGIVRALYNRRKAIIGISFLTTVLVAGLSLLMPDFYEAETIFYAASPDLAKPSPIGIGAQKRDYYGESEDIDRLLSIAESSELKARMIAHFDLYTHYEIPRDSKLADYKVMMRLSKAFKIEKNKYDAIRLAIEDKNPILSRDITNVARDTINGIAQKLIKDSQKKLLTTFEASLESKELQVTQLNKQLDSLRNKYEIYDTKSQGQVIAEILSTTRAKYEVVKSRINSYKSRGIYSDSIRALGIQEQALKNSLSSISSQAKNFSNGLAVVMSLENEQSEASDQLAIDKERYKLLKSTYESDFSALHVVEFANKPQRKSRPKRSILVISAGAATFLLSCLAAIIFAFYKKVNWTEVLKDE